MVELDRSLFAFFNQNLVNQYFDSLMPVITNEHYWTPFLVALLLWLIFSSGGKYRFFALMLCISVGSSDYLTAGIIKKKVKRLRPCCDIPESRKLIGCLTGKSFPSAHAANSSNLAFMLFFEMGTKVGLPAIFAAIVVAYSRVYVGVHYPIDVLTGFILGFLIAFIMTKIKEKIRNRPALETCTLPEPPENNGNSVTHDTIDNSNTLTQDLSHGSIGEREQ
ncbi:MAG: phosphatase PAP2 family protein [Candidatus Riflebacteria bacterium]|nr:phosphatase PAP2 family protein [Candidatus Riflebacteria bacterium]